MATRLRTLPTPHRLPLVTQTRSLSTQARLTKLLLPVNEGNANDARRELKWMREEISRVQLLADGDKRSPVTRLEEMVKQRAAGKPLQYVLGNQPFGTLLINVRPPVLIPRPETDEWASKLAALLQSSLDRSFSSSRLPLRILDLCTGTGCIPLLLCASLPKGTVHATGVDILPDAVSLARENALASDVSLAGAADTREGRNTFEVLEWNIFTQGFLQEMLGVNGKRNPDLLTSNPPYIPLAELEGLDRSVSEYESHLALLGDVPHLAKPSPLPPSLSHLLPNRGLDFYLLIGDLIARGLVRSPSPSSPTSAAPQIVLEVGHDQAGEVEEILMKGPAGGRMERTERWVDMGGKERVVVGWLKARAA